MMIPEEGKATTVCKSSTTCARQLTLVSSTQNGRGVIAKTTSQNPKIRLSCQQTNLLVISEDMAKKKSAVAN